MALKHFSQSNTLVFSVISPGGDSLAKDLDSMESEDSTQSFIDSTFEKKYVYDIKALDNIRLAYFVSYKNQTPQYSLHETGDPHEERVEINEAHPLSILSKSYENSLRDRKSINIEEMLNAKSIYKNAQEIFDVAYRLYREGKPLYQKSMEKFRNFLRDPLCLCGAILGKMDIEEESFASPLIDSKQFVKPQAPSIPFLLAPLPADVEQNMYALTAGDSAPQSSSLVRASENDTPRAMPALSETEVWYQEQVPRMHSLMVQNKNGAVTQSFLQVLKERVQTREKRELTKAEFLYFCLSELPFFNNPVTRSLAEYVFAREKGATLKPSKDDIKQLREEYYPFILLQCMTTIGNLQANIEGVRTLVKEIQRGANKHAPKIFIANCSLSDIYAGSEERQRRFESLMKNLNPFHHRQRRAFSVGLCVIPKVPFGNGEQESDFFASSETSLSLLDLAGDTRTADIQLRPLNDATTFGDCVRFLRFLSKQEIGVMTLVSTDKDLSYLSERELDPDQGEVAALAQMFKEQLDDYARMHASFCVPDATFLPAFTVGMGDRKIRIPAIPVKAAFLVGALLIRNDQPEILRAILPHFSEDIQEQPGVGIGPEVLYEEKQLQEEFPQLFEIERMGASDMDVEIVEFFLKRSTSTRCSYSFLHHARQKPIALQLCNTLAADERGRAVPVSRVRSEDYLKTLRMLHPEKDEEFWEEALHEKTKMEDENDALVFSDRRRKLINALHL